MTKTPQPGPDPDLTDEELAAIREAWQRAVDRHTTVVISPETPPEDAPASWRPRDMVALLVLLAVGALLIWATIDPTVDVGARP